ncbi:hypothetical protein D3C87_755760 [compost metagenome]
MEILEALTKDGKSPEYDFAITPTILNAFNRYMRNDDDESWESLFNIINGEKRDLPDNVLKGIQFESLINKMIEGFDTEVINGMVLFGGYQFKADVVYKVFKKLRACQTKQEKISVVIPSHLGLIKLHGVLDYGYPKMITDLKTTEVYKCNKYIKNTQHQIYSLIRKLKGNPVDSFKYLVTDFEKVYQETYVPTEKMFKNLLFNVFQLINFLVLYKDYITNTKIFGKAA